MKVAVKTEDDLWRLFWREESGGPNQPGEIALNFGDGLKKVLEYKGYGDDSKSSLSLTDRARFYLLRLCCPLGGPKRVMMEGGYFRRIAVVAQADLLSIGKAMDRHSVVGYPLDVEYLGHALDTEHT